MQDIRLGSRRQAFEDGPGSDDGADDEHGIERRRSGSPSSAPGRSATITTSRRSSSTPGPSWPGPATPTPALLERRKSEWGIDFVTTDPEVICADPRVDAVIIATPNFTHLPIALAAARHGKHVMCEKPLGVNKGEVQAMYEAVRDAKVVHMTAFTYRFAPSMRYLRHLLKSGALGTPRHFRSQRFLDWPETSWGWRQYKDLAGAGDLYDMTIHRIDFALDLLGPIKSVCGAVAQFVPRDKTPDGKPCKPSEVDDWSSLIGEFESGAVGVWEGTTLAKGYHRDGFGHEWAEINGSEGSAVYRLHEPNTIMLGKTGSATSPWCPSPRSSSSRPEPPRPEPGQARHRLPLRPGVGVRLGHRRRPTRRAELLRRAQRPDHRRRGARIARRSEPGSTRRPGRLCRGESVRPGITRVVGERGRGVTPGERNRRTVRGDRSTVRAVPVIAQPVTILRSAPSGPSRRPQGRGTALDGRARYTRVDRSAGGLR